MECAQRMIFVENIVTGLLGCALLGFSIYVWVNYAPWSAFVSMNAVYIALAAGVCLVLVACVGGTAATKKSLRMLLLYAVLCVLVLALTSAAAIISMTLNQRLNIISGSTIIPAAIVDQTARNMYDEILSAYVVCCEGCTPAQACNNPLVPQSSNGTAFCPVGVCSPVAVCASTDDDSCFALGTTVVPPRAPDVTVCTFLESINVNVGSTSVPIVGPAAAASCGLGSPATFVTDVAGYFNSKLLYVGIGFCVVAGIQLFNLITLIVLLCHLHRTQQSREGE